MAFNQGFVKPETVAIRAHSNANSTSNLASIINNRSSQNSQKYNDELSSSGVDSDWILFSPAANEEKEVELDNESDVLSSTNDDDHGVVPFSMDLQQEPQEHEDEEDEDDDDDDDSLIESLGPNTLLKLPTHNGSGIFENQEECSTEDSYYTSLKKNDYITNRIDNWRKEQAKLLINDLQRGSDTSSDLGAGSPQASDLLASWGVDDRLFVESDNLDDGEVTTTTQEEITTPTSTVEHTNNKRFYGDDLFEGCTPWEVNKIKKLARQYSPCLQRDRSSLIDNTYNLPSHLRGRRTSFLSNLSKSANKYLMDQTLIDQPFWKKDISSAHSSLSLSANSIMFGNLNLGDVI